MPGFTQTGFSFYLDAQLVHPVVAEFLPPPGFTFQLGGAYIGFAIDINALDVSSQQGDVQVWLGSPTNIGQAIEDGTNPGVTNISVSAADSFVPVGSSPNPTTRFYLALTESGLNSAVAGASLNLGVAIISGGFQNAVSFWVRYKVSVPSPEFGCNETIYTNIYLGTQSLILVGTASP